MAENGHSQNANLFPDFKIMLKIPCNIHRMLSTQEFVIACFLSLEMDGNPRSSDWILDLFETSEHSVGNMFFPEFSKGGDGIPKLLWILAVSVWKIRKWFGSKADSEVSAQRWIWESKILYFDKLPRFIFSWYYSVSTQNSLSYFSQLASLSFSFQSSLPL